MTGRRFLLVVVTSVAFLVPVAADDEERTRDEQILRDAGLTWDGPALLDYFHKRTIGDAQREQIQALIQKTGDSSFKVRQAASRELEALGLTAVGPLKQAERSRDPEVARRARAALAKIEKVPSNLLTAAVARMVGRVKPPAGLEALLAFVPLADDEMAADAIRWSLTRLALRDDKPEPPLLAALRDSAPLRRSAAGEALVQAKAAGTYADVRKLLRDPNTEVRMRVALALATSAHDKSAVPELIALLAALPQELGLQVEETLCRIAGDDGPKVSLVGEEGAKGRCREAWAEWWSANSDHVDLTRLDVEPRLFGYTLVVQMSNTGLGGKVIEYAADGKTIRWQIDGLQMPLDAQVLPHSQHVLLAEHNAHQVAERDFQGKIHWRYAVTAPIGCQRMSNGNTFIASRDQLLEVDARGKPVFTFNRGESDIVAARKGSDGQYVYATRLGRVARIDGQGKEVRAFTTSERRLYNYASLQLLPKNHVLITHMHSVAEYDELAGKQTWQVAVSRPVSAVRLPNGHALVASLSPAKIIEFDRDGKSVWEETLQDAAPWRVLRR
ncbi:MAG: HEAT repeat domain-containing protein [Gemmataceae bacterium]